MNLKLSVIRLNMTKSVLLFGQNTKIHLGEVQLKRILPDITWIYQVKNIT